MTPCPYGKEGVHPDCYGKLHPLINNKELRLKEVSVFLFLLLFKTLFACIEDVHFYYSNLPSVIVTDYDRRFCRDIFC